MPDNLIKIHHVSKKYSGKIVLEDIDLNVDRGSCIALAGINGSGKSTLLRIAAKLTAPDGGSVKHCKDLKIQYIPDRFPKMELTPAQYLMHMAAIEEAERTAAEQKAEELFQKFFMEGMKNTPMKYLSKGTLQKTAVIQALMTKPDLLLMDEPLSGQDTASQEAFIREIKKMEDGGVSVLLACHEKELIYRLAEEVYEIKKRKLQKAEKEWYLPKQKDCLIFEGDADRELPVTDHDEGIIHVEVQEGSVKIISECELSNEVIKNMLKFGWQLRRMQREED